MDPDLPAKMQFSIAQVCNDWLDSARFELPDEGSLGWTQVKQDILQKNHSLSLLPNIMNILHPTIPSKVPKGEGRNTKERGAMVQHENHDKDLKCSKKFFKSVIYPHIIGNGTVPVPKFSGNCAECLNFAFCGICYDKCNRKKAHKTARDNRKRASSKSRRIVLPPTRVATEATSETWICLHQS